MREQKYGRIVSTSSAAGIFGNFGQTNYGAAKMGLVGLMQTLSIEGAKHDIRVNCLAPTAATRMTEDLMPPQILEALKPEAVVPAMLVLVGVASTAPITVPASVAVPVPPSRSVGLLAPRCPRHLGRPRIPTAPTARACAARARPAGLPDLEQPGTKHPALARASGDRGAGPAQRARAHYRQLFHARFQGG